MKGYRKPSGVYIELSDHTPVGNALVEVALRPSPRHVFTANWQDDPLNTSTCWRLQTATERRATQDTELQDYLDRVGGKVAKSIVNTLVQKGVCTLADIRTAYRSL